MRDGWAARLKQGHHSHPALQDASDDVFNARIGDVSGRGKLAGDMREIWMMQPRFEKRVGGMPFGLIDQPRFRAAFDFMRLRADAGEVEDVLADWWQEFSTAHDDIRQDMVDQVRDEQQKRQRAPKVHKLPKAQPVENTQVPVQNPLSSDNEVSVQGEAGDAPKKRRRRRRSTGPKAAGEAAPDAGV